MQSAYFVLAVALIGFFKVSYRLLFPKPEYKEGMKRRFVFEVVKLVQEAKSRADKVNILHSNLGPGLAGILRMNFDAQLELDVDVDMPYRPRKEHDAIDTLDHSSKIWSTFTKHSRMDRTRKNLRFKSMLESLEPREAELFILAAKRQLKLGLSKVTLSKCLPEIFKKTN